MGGMDTIVARPNEEAKIPTQEVKKRESTYSSPSTGDVPLEVYNSENSTSYIDELMGVDELLPIEMKKSVESIDEYITNLMSEKGYKPTTEAYKSALEGIKKELGLDKNTSVEETVSRLSKYIEAEGMLKSLKTIDEEKILKQLKSPTQSLMELVMKQIEKKGL
jgi:hypothetical protein